MLLVKNEWHMLVKTTVEPQYSIHFWETGKKYVLSKCPLRFIIFLILKESDIF